MHFCEILVEYVTRYLFAICVISFFAYSSYGLS